MSIYFDYDVGPTGRRFRRAVDGDKDEIKLFCKHSDTYQIFGDVDIGYLIELSALSICMVNEKKEVVGFMALSDHPNVPSVDPAAWEHWIRNMYDKFYVSRNTLFIHFMSCDDSVTDTFVEEALISVFMNDPYLNFIVLLVPMNFPEKLYARYPKLKKYHIMKCKSKGDGVGNNLWTFVKTVFCPKLKIRRAVQEDNDDVVKLLDAKCPRLKELYGEFYISEIIGCHPESNRRILVVDVQGRAVGVMCLNDEIDYEKLERVYELKAYYDLRSATPLEKETRKRANKLLIEFGLPIMEGKYDPFGDRTELKVPKETKLPKQKSKINVKRSRVLFKSKVWKRPRSDRNITEIENDNLHRVSSTVSLAYYTNPSTKSIANFLDEELCEYDIINIARSLLHVDDMLPPEIRATTSNYIQETPQYTKPIIKRRRRRRKPMAKLEGEPKATAYTGKKNVFMIELFALSDDIDPRQSYDFLEAAFELYKDYTYCIIRIPSSEKTFPLLRHFCFVPVKNQIHCEYSLYIAHRNSVLGKLRAKEAEIVEIPRIAQLLCNLEARETIWTMENMIQEQQYKPVVFISGAQLIGLGIIQQAEKLDFLHARFNIDAYQIRKYHYSGMGTYAGFGVIKCVLIFPAFEPHNRFFIREMMRLSGCTSLLWLTAFRNKWLQSKANTLVASMIPLLPLRFKIDGEVASALKDINQLSKSTVPFSAWYIGKKYTTVPKVNINTNIVLVGASRTTFGFLNTLLFGQTSTYLTFTNITLVAPYGLPIAKQTNSLVESMFCEFFAMSDKYLKSVPYTYYLNIIPSKLVEMDLQGKSITLNNGHKFYYDFLFLFMGIQYQLPGHMDHLMEKEKIYWSGGTPKYIPQDDPNQSDTELHITSDQRPENMFIINALQEAEAALEYVKSIMGSYDYKIIVYGTSINSYLCINTLLKMRVPAKHIIFIEPFPPENPKKIRVPLFCNSNVDLTVNNILTDLGIKVYRSCYLSSWTVISGNLMTHAYFLSYTQYFKLDCSAMFYYGKRGMDLMAYVAIHKSGLAYDGAIVINHECRTLDPYVYAAGPATRYQRKYYAADRVHKYYHSYEIGQKLGELTRNSLDPLFKSPSNIKRRVRWSHNFGQGTQGTPRSSVNSYDVRPQSTLIKFKEPRTLCCTMPGGYKYLEVRPPGKLNPHHYVQSLDFQGYVLETFKQGYFKIHMTKDFKVDGVTCLTRENFCLENFNCLFGQSGVVLNHVHLRYQTNKLDNFFEFFRAPWAYFLYYDDAAMLFAMTKQLFPKGQSKGLTLEEALKEKEIRIEKRALGNFETSPHIEAVTDYVLDWLANYEILLPIYLHPSQLPLYDDLTTSLFRRKKKKIADMLI